MTDYEFLNALKRHANRHTAPTIMIPQKQFDKLRESELMRGISTDNCLILDPVQSGTVMWNQDKQMFEPRDPKYRGIR